LKFTSKFAKASLILQVWSTTIKNLVRVSRQKLRKFSD